MQLRVAKENLLVGRHFRKQEQMKTERKLISKEQKEAMKQRQFSLKQQKRKEKHRGQCH